MREGLPDSGICTFELLLNTVGIALKILADDRLQLCSGGSGL